jgi:hypothetical protein
MKRRRRLEAALALALVFLSVETAVVPDDEVAPAARPEHTPPGPPTLNYAISGTHSVRLAWSAASSGGSAISGYRIYRGTQRRGENLVTPVASVGDILSYTDDAVSAGVTYYYKVSAVNVAGEGALSGEKFATPAAARSAGTEAHGRR